MSPLPEVDNTPEIQLGPSKTVEMMLIVGGMDTEGEVFDDCLVCLLKDHGEDVDASAAASDDVLNGATST